MKGNIASQVELKSHYEILYANGIRCILHVFDLVLIMSHKRDNAHDCPYFISIYFTIAPKRCYVF